MAKPERAQNGSKKTNGVHTTPPAPATPQWPSVEELNQMSHARRNGFCQAELRAAVAPLLTRYPEDDVRFYLEGLSNEMGRERDRARLAAKKASWST